MKTEQIDVPHFEGYKCVGYKVPRSGQYYPKDGNLVAANDYHSLEWLVYEKVPPKRYIFEETGEYRKVKTGDFYFREEGTISRWYSKRPSLFEYKILRKVDEG